MPRLGLEQVIIFIEKGDFNLTSPYGYRYDPIYKDWRGHKGVDGNLWKGWASGATLCSPGTGKVVDTRDDVQLITWSSKELADEAQRLGVTAGNTIDILHDDGKYTRYQHLAYKSIKVKVGDRVDARQPIALMGTTGKSTGVHIHFEVYTVVDGKKVWEDPLPYITGEKKIGVVEEMGYPVLGKDEYVNATDKNPASVTKVQQLLVHKFGYQLEIDGQWSDMLDKAIRDYQSEHGLKVDARVGPATIESLNRDLYEEIKELRKAPGVNPKELKELQEAYDSMKLDRDGLLDEKKQLQNEKAALQNKVFERDLKITNIKNAIEVFKSI